LQRLAEAAIVPAMDHHTLNVTIGDQVYLHHNDEEIGAVREVARDHLIVYIENRGDVRIDGSVVKAAHDGKVVLDPSKLDRDLLAAIRVAHQLETD
jgi:hypothetical protein